MGKQYRSVKGQNFFAPNRRTFHQFWLKFASLSQSKSGFAEPVHEDVWCYRLSDPIEFDSLLRITEDSINSQLESLFQFSICDL